MVGGCLHGLLSTKPGTKSAINLYAAIGGHLEADPHTHTLPFWIFAQSFVVLSSTLLELLTLIAMVQATHNITHNNLQAYPEARLAEFLCSGFAAAKRH